MSNEHPRRLRRLAVSKYLSTLKYGYADYTKKDMRYPFYCSLKVIQRCDSRCEFCEVWRKPIPDMPKEKLLKIIDNIANSSVLVLSLEGGEPLLRSDIGEVLEYIRTKPLYVLFTTSGKLMDRRPMKDYAKLIDFLHISIDEGHKNLDLFDRLPEYTSWGPIVCVQIVVMKQYLQDLEGKIAKCHKAGAKAVVMPACHMPGTEDHLPDLEAFRNEVMRLSKKYPKTIVTTDKYLRSLDALHSCNAGTLRIDADGLMHYPCHMDVQTMIDASKESIIDFLNTQKADECRKMMKNCDINCHIYAYNAIESSLSLRSTVSGVLQYVRRSGS